MRRAQAPADIGAGREWQPVGMPLQADESGQRAAVRYLDRQVAHAGVALRGVAVAPGAQPQSFST